MAVAVAKGKLTVSTEAAWEKCCPSRGRSLPAVMGAGITSREIIQPLSSKNVGFLLLHWEKTQNKFFLLGDL